MYYSVEICKEIEYAIVGSLVQWNSELHDRIAEISPDDFYIEDCRKIFLAVASLGSSSDHALVASAVPWEARTTLVEALDYALSVHSFDSYLIRLKEISQSRRLKNCLAQMVYDNTAVTLPDLQALVEQEQSGGRFSLGVEQAASKMDSFISDIGVKKPRVMTGFSNIDRLTGGLRIPAVSIIGAAPSTGKTALALNMALRQNCTVVIFSLEMSYDMIVERMVSNLMSLDYNLFSTQEFTQEQLAKVKGCAEHLKERSIHIFDEVYDIEGQAAVINRIKPSLVVVDYIQKVQTKKHAENRRNEIDYISGQYKQLAKYNNCHIMLLSQISRLDRNLPTMASLKESGALEADGDYVMLLHRPYVLRKDQGDPAEAHLLIDKNKFGGTGRVELRFDGKYQRFLLFDGFTECQGGVPKEWI